MPDDHLKDLILGTVEASLDAQLRAVRRLRHRGPAAPPRARKGLSQVDMADDVSRRPAGRCTSRRFSLASGPSSTCRSIARAWCRRSPRRSRAGIASCAPTKTPSACARRGGDRRAADAAGHVPQPRRAVARRVSAAAHPSARGPPGGGLVVGWAAAVCRGSSGPTGASAGVGARSISCTRGVTGIPTRCSRRS